MMSENDLDAITGYIRDGFGSLGIVPGNPFIENGVIHVNCHGIHPLDGLTAADRIAQEMGRKGWDVDVWFDEMENELKVSQKEKEDRMVRQAKLGRTNRMKGVCTAKKTTCR